MRVVHILRVELMGLQRFPFWLVILLTTVSSSLFAQTTRISGKVTDAETGESLPFVNISFQDSKIGTSSDINGEFEVETYYATDSLTASFVGYTPLTMKVRKDHEQTINFALENSKVELSEVVIEGSRKDENPAHPIVRAVIANRKINNREKLDSYEYEAYNKVEFDLNNLTDDFKNRRVFRPFQFVFDNIDSTSESKEFLPLFITESLSDYYYRKSPKTQKEFIRATKVSGTDNESVQQFLGDMYQNVNVYENYVPVFGKNFVSPIAGFGFTYYRYYLMDSAFVGNNWCYKIRFMPKRKQETTFVGDMWIADTTYAVRKVDVSVSEDANINFVNELRVHQEYEQVQKEVWMLTQDELVVDFNLTKKTMGFYGRRSASYRNFVINEKREDDFYKGIGNIIVADDAGEKSEEFWNENRHDSLSQNEAAIYQISDTMATIPAFNTYVDILNTIFVGYKVMGPVELGPYFYLFSNNPVEGARVRFGGRTSNDFSTRLKLEGYGAYGFRDERFKYGVGFLYFLSKKPRQSVYAYYRDDVEQLGQSENAFSTGNVVNSFFRRTDTWKLTRIEEFKTYYEREWFEGFSSKLMFRRRRIYPLGDLSYQRSNPEVNELETVENITASEFIIHLRWAHKEKFLSGEFQRTSLGTKWPLVSVQLTAGLKGTLGGEYEYRKLRINLQHKFHLGPLGHTKYFLEAGTIWGALPYPLLELHQGNETYWYYGRAFNAMNFYEFISDNWATAMAEHHFDGFFLNRIPLFRKLKWREVVSGKIVFGRLSEKHEQQLLLEKNMFSLNDGPYYEGAVGIENIFKVLRLDLLYRLSYLDHQSSDFDIVRVGLRGTLHVDF